MSELVMYTIYDHPKDFPNTAVCRVWRVGDSGVYADSQPYIVGPTVDEVRYLLRARHPGLSCFHRSPEDDPVIAETWL